MTRILSVFNLLKRVGFALLLLGVIVVDCFAQDWETPIQLTNNPQWWDSGPALIVDSSLNLHVFAIRHNPNLYDSTGGEIIPHVLCYMKFNNWGVPLINERVLHDPTSEYAEVYGPAATLDLNGHLHVFWAVWDWGTWYIGYLMMDEFGTVLVGPDTLVIAEGQDVFETFSAMHASVSLDGRVWAIVGNGFVAVTEDGVQIDSTGQLHPTEDVFWPTLAPGPDSSMWTSFRWGVSNHVSLRRLDDPLSVPLDITTHAGQYGLFIGDDGNRYLVISSSDSSYLLSVSGDGLIRDSVAFTGAGFSVTRGSVLVEASNDSLLHFYRSTGGDSAATFVWFSRDNRVLRGPERYEVPNFRGFESSLSATPSGGYWLLGAFVTGGWPTNLGMLHVPGVGEPSFSTERPFITDKFSVSVYPNPFNAQATLQYHLDRAGNVHIVLYDLLGRVVQSYPAQFMPAGEHIMPIDAATLASGSYWVSLNTAQQTLTTKIILIR